MAALVQVDFVSVFKYKFSCVSFVHSYRFEKAIHILKILLSSQNYLFAINFSIVLLFQNFKALFRRKSE